MTPLHIAVMQGNIELVELLLSFGADANASDNTGNTPLSIAQTLSLSKKEAFRENRGITGIYKIAKTLPLPQKEAMIQMLQHQEK